MTTLTVSQLNRYIKSVLDEANLLQNIYVSGEISNFKHYPSGHIYFTLKDSASQLKCVMFSSDNTSLRFRPENGMNVVCFGRIGVYERDGAYQLYVKGMQPKGIGELALAYEQLKETLEKRGWFSPLHKKPIPKYPKKIGVATSNMGAAVEDIKNIISRRFPICELAIVPTVVQGENAKNDIARSVEFLDELGVDTIIVGRGGGSLEDLWAFNTIEVAQAVYNCKTPVISAVGHETDYTICDFVSDLRAPTPSAAAELAVPDINSELSYIEDVRAFMNKSVNHKILELSQRLDSLSRFDSISVSLFISPYFEQLALITKKMNEELRNIINRKQLELSKAASMLNALSPLAVLGRGYSLTLHNDAVITSASEVKADDLITTRLKSSTIISRVTEVKYE
ncbi:MAG: exodeoxyribonuclease VII large subunit [Eubacteriales bacterium]|nr:exodeoxyribonuclease VII large subunit [Eubacteriales bacterium]